MDNKFKLLSLQNEELVVEASMVQESLILRNSIEEVDHIARDVGGKDAIPLPMGSKVVAQVIEYCQYHLESRTSFDGKPAIADDKVKEWDESFIKMDYPDLVALIQAANFLEIGTLLKLASKAVANMMTDNSAEEIREMISRNHFDHRGKGREDQAGEGMGSPITVETWPTQHG